MRTGQSHLSYLGLKRKSICPVMPSSPTNVLALEAILPQEPAYALSLIWDIRDNKGTPPHFLARVHIGEWPGIMSLLAFLAPIKKSGKVSKGS